MDYRIISLMRNGVGVVVENYIFVVKCVLKSGDVNIRCRDYHRLKCPAKGIIRNRKVTLTNSKHNHGVHDVLTLDVRSKTKTALQSRINLGKPVKKICDIKNEANLLSQFENSQYGDSLLQPPTSRANTMCRRRNKQLCHVSGDQKGICDKTVDPTSKPSLLSQTQPRESVCDETPCEIEETSEPQLLSSDHVVNMGCPGSVHIYSQHETVGHTNGLELHGPQPPAMSEPMDINDKRRANKVAIPKLSFSLSKTWSIKSTRKSFRKSKECKHINNNSLKSNKIIRPKMYSSVCGTRSSNLEEKSSERPTDYNGIDANGCQESNQDIAQRATLLHGVIERTRTETGLIDKLYNRENGVVSASRGYVGGPAQNSFLLRNTHYDEILLRSGSGNMAKEILDETTSLTQSRITRQQCLDDVHRIAQEILVLQTQNMICSQLSEPRDDRTACGGSIASSPCYDKTEKYEKICAKRVSEGQGHSVICDVKIESSNVIKDNSTDPITEGNFICTYPGCDKSFGTSQRLQVHYLRHTGQRPYKCSFHSCSKSFTTAGNLKNHERIHLDEKPFTCNECGKSFIEKSTLKKHSLTHTDIRPHLCDICGDSFKQRSTLICHKSKIHHLT